MDGFTKFLTCGDRKILKNTEVFKLFPVKRAKYESLNLRMCMVHCLLLPGSLVVQSCLGF